MYLLYANLPNVVLTRVVAARLGAGLGVWHGANVQTEVKNIISG
jgi:hypothetical protein